MRTIQDDEFGRFFREASAGERKRSRNPGALMGIKPTVPVGPAGSVRHNYDIGNVIFPGNVMAGS